MTQNVNARPFHWIGILILFLSITALGCLSPTIVTPTVKHATSTPEKISPDTETGKPINSAEITISSDEEEKLLINLYNRVNPAVVHIRIYEGGVLLGSGSGFFVDSDGHIVTNNHVVQDAEEMEIIYWDETRIRGEVIGSDLDADLAVVQVEKTPDGVIPLELGNSDDVVVGQRVIAIGNPFGLQGTMTTGIVSGVGRRLESQRQQDLTGGTYSNPDIIQTDAAINPGNSGGPLLNSEGAVIGINTAIRSLSGSNSGVGFAAPVNTIKKLLPHLIEEGSYTYPWMGISGLQEIDLNTAEALGLSQTKGVYVTTVSDGGPADQAGVIPASPTNNSSDLLPGTGGDLIIKIDDYEVNDFSDLVSYLVASTEPGQVIELTVIRNGDTIVIPLTLGERP